MQIVIDIPERDYKTIIAYPRNELEIAVKLGVPLPKGHDRLVEYDKIEVEEDVYNQCFIVDAPTVLEADKES